MNIINWLTDNWAAIVQIVTGLVAVASLIVRLTPTLADDSALLPVVKFLGRFVALNRPADADEKRPE